MRLMERPLLIASRTAFLPNKISSLSSIFLGLAGLFTGAFRVERVLADILFLGLFFVGRI